jgi:hypothetical protein
MFSPCLQDFRNSEEPFIRFSYNLGYKEYISKAFFHVCYQKKLNRKLKIIFIKVHNQIIHLTQTCLRRLYERQVLVGVNLRYSY